jgi:hypothetical protein
MKGSGSGAKGQLWSMRDLRVGGEIQENRDGHE